MRIPCQPPGKVVEHLHNVDLSDIVEATAPQPPIRVNQLRFQVGLVFSERRHQARSPPSKAIAEQKSGGDYTPMLREIVAFFHTGKTPVSPELTLEIYAFMEAADESIRQGGKPISIPEYLRKNGWEK